MLDTDVSACHTGLPHHARGRFYRSVLIKVLRRINAYLVRWAQGKYKRLRRYPARARRFLVDVFRRQPDLFAHWRFGTRPDGWTMGAR
jgi:RNA-directed DNA polymerase